MEHKGLFVICVLSFIVFSAALVWRILNTKDDSDVKITYTSYIVNEENEEKSVSDGISTTKALSERTKSRKTTVAVTKENKEIDEPLYLDINNADMEELCLLDGIGEVLAQAIISYREENSGFNNIEEIMNVHGIGEGIFEDIRDFIYVENPIYPEPDLPSDDEEDYDDTSENDEEYDEEIEYDEETVTDSPLTLEEAAPIDINSADLELLVLLPHIDEDIAEKIIEMRENIGGFKNTYELLYIDGISREQADEILEFICVESEYSQAE